MEPNQTNEIHQENSIGPVIAIIIVLLMVILGGIYFWGERNNATEQIQPTMIDESNVDSAALEIQSQSSSDDANSIEADLNSTEIDSIGSDLNNL